MNITRKPRATPAGKPVSEMTRLKALWMTMSEDEQAGWSSLLASDSPQPEIRRLILEGLKIELRHDKQLRRLRVWLGEQEAMEAVRAKAAGAEAELRRQGLTGDELRNELLKRMKEHALAYGDFKLGLKTVAEDIKAEALQFEKSKFRENLKSKIQAGLEAILTEAKGNTQIAAAVRQIQEATV